MENIGTRRESNGEDYVLNADGTGKCFICSVLFTSRQLAEQHLAGKSHLKKLKSLSTSFSQTTYSQAAHIGSTTTEGFNPQLENSKGSNREEYVIYGTRGYCNVCSLEFTSVEHAQSHITGQKHLKKVKEFRQENLNVSSVPHEMRSPRREGLDLPTESENNVIKEEWKEVNSAELPFMAALIQYGKSSNSAAFKPRGAEEPTLRALSESPLRQLDKTNLSLEKQDKDLVSSVPFEQSLNRRMQQAPEPTGNLPFSSSQNTAQPRNMQTKELLANTQQIDGSLGSRVIDHDPDQTEVLKLVPSRSTEQRPFHSTGVDQTEVDSVSKKFPVPPHDSSLEVDMKALSLSHSEQDANLNKLGSGAQKVMSKALEIPMPSLSCLSYTSQGETDSIIDNSQQIGCNEGTIISNPTLSNQAPSNQSPWNQIPSSLSPLNSIPPNSIPPNSIPPNSIPQNSIPPNSIPPNSIPPNSIPPNSIPPNSIPPNSIPPNSIPPNSIPPNSVPSNFIPPNSIPPNSIPSNSIPPNFIPPNSSLSNQIPSNSGLSRPMPTYPSPPVLAQPTNTLSTSRMVAQPLNELSPQKQDTVQREINQMNRPTLERQQHRGSGYPLMCKLCANTFNGQSSASQHFNSDKHKMKEKMLFDSTLLEQYEGARKVLSDGMIWYLCEICIRPLNTREQLDIHKASKRHHDEVQRRADMLKLCQNSEALAQTARIAQPTPPPLIGSSVMSHPVASNHQIPSNRMSSPVRETTMLGHAGDVTRQQQTERDSNRANTGSPMLHLHQTHQQAMVVSPDPGVYRVTTSQQANTGSPESRVHSAATPQRSVALSEGLGMHNNTTTPQRSVAVSQGLGMHNNTTTPQRSVAVSQGLGMHNNTTTPQWSVAVGQGLGMHNNTTQQAVDDTLMNNFYVFDGSRGHCYVCNVSMTSVIEKDNHINGRPHRRAVERQGRTVAGEYPLICHLCANCFTGQESAMQHFTSDKHKTKLDVVHNSTLLEQYEGARKVLLNETPWFVCDICICPLNTLNQLNIHRQSKRHHEEARRREDFRNTLNHESDEGLARPGRDEVQPSPHSSEVESIISRESLASRPQQISSGAMDSRLDSSASTPDLQISSDSSIEAARSNQANHVSEEQQTPRDRELAGNHYQGSMSATENRVSAEVSGFTGNGYGQNSSAYGAGNLGQGQLTWGVGARPKHSGATTGQSQGSSYSSGSTAQGQPGTRATTSPTQSSQQTTMGSSANRSTQEANESDPTGFPNNEPYPDISSGDGRLSRANAEGLDEFGTLVRNSSARTPSRSGSRLGLRNMESMENQELREDADLGPEESSENFNIVDEEVDSTVTKPPVEVKIIRTTNGNYYCEICKKSFPTLYEYKKHAEGIRHMNAIGTQPAQKRKLPPIKKDGFTDHDVDDTVDNGTMTKPRIYQFQLFDKACNKDSIVYLPTGTGKTLIAVLLIHLMLRKNPHRPVLFLVDKVLLVLQQAKVILAQFKDKTFERASLDKPGQLETRGLLVKIICGEFTNKTQRPIYQHDIIITTADYCINMLKKGQICWSDFSLVVLDEVHHCDKNHPYCRLFLAHHHPLPQAQRPKVLGLTASPAGKMTVEKTYAKLKELLSNLGNAKIVFVDNDNGLEELATVQSNTEVYSECVPMTPREQVLEEQLLTYFVMCYANYARMSTDLRNKRDTPHIYFVDAVENPENRQIAATIAGNIMKDREPLYEIFRAILSAHPKPAFETHFDYLRNHLQELYMAVPSIGTGETSDKELRELFSDSEEKPNYGLREAQRLGLPCGEMLAHVEQFVATDNGTDNWSMFSRLVQTLQDPRYINWSDEKCKALVLVRERKGAHHLCKQLRTNEYIKKNGLIVHPLVGHGKSGQGAAGMNVKRQKSVVDNHDKIHIIVATSIAEEGVDFQTLQLVVCLNPPTSVRGLVQMRGRARRKESHFVILCQSEEEQAKVDELKIQEQRMQEAAERMRKEECEIGTL